MSDLLNMHFEEEGSLTKRMGATQQSRRYPNAAVTDLPAPSVTQVAGGSIAVATYYVSYTLQSISQSGESGCSAEVEVIVGVANRKFEVLIQAVNSGEGAGRVGAQMDDPLSAGYKPPAAISGVDPLVICVYMRTGADSRTKQAIVAYELDDANYAWQCDVSAYTNTGAADPNQQRYVPVRSLVWDPTARYLFGWYADRVHVLIANGSSALAGVCALQNDSSGNPVRFARFPSKICAAMLNGVLVACDGFGKPKRYHYNALPTSSGWRLLGANAPTVIPVCSDGAGALTPGHTFAYAYSYIYTSTKSDGTTYIAESVPTASCALYTVPAGGGISVAFTTSTEAGVSYRIYRTENGGTQVYFLTDVISSPYADDGDPTVNTALTPVNSATKVPPATPVQKLYYITSHASRLWAVVMAHVIVLGRVEAIYGTNTFYYTKTNEPDAWSFSKIWGNGRTTGIHSSRGFLYIFFLNEIGVVEGSGISDLDFDFRNIKGKVGAIEHSIIEVGDNIYFLDPNDGPQVLNGFSAQDIGHEAIHDLWRYLATSYVICRAVEYDYDYHTIKWVITSQSCRPGQFSTEPTVQLEIVLYLPTGGWSIYQGETITGQTRKDRQITALASVPSYASAYPNTIRAIEAPRHQLFFGDTYGRMCIENQAEYDTDPENTATHQAISYRAQFSFVFGGSAEMVKHWKYIFAHFALGGSATAFSASDVLTIAASYLSRVMTGGYQATLPSVSTVKSFTGTAGTYLDQFKRCDIPASLIGNLSQERGLLIRAYGTASNRTVIKGLVIKFKDISDLRSAP